MPLIRSLAISGAALLAATAGAQAGVTVSFDHPERYTDAGLYNGYSAKARAATMNELQRYLEQLGARYLKPDQVLSVEVRDIDLAGRYEPLRGGAYDVRVLDPATWPKIVVRYTLVQDGRTLLSAEETIQDLDYLARPNARFSTGPLRYEKEMLDAWFKAHFVERRPA